MITARYIYRIAIDPASHSNLGMRRHDGCDFRLTHILIIPRRGTCSTFYISWLFKPKSNRTLKTKIQLKWFVWPVAEGRWNSWSIEASNDVTDQSTLLTKGGYDGNNKIIRANGWTLVVTDIRQHIVIKQATTPIPLWHIGSICSARHFNGPPGLMESGGF